MRLKGLRLHGFKSFAERTEFRFPEGVTCIVGPNGCGKSNVVDGVKWVLGEQRPTAMRGSEMADVIFSGTERRKAVGLAEVTLIFDNSDRGLGVEWQEVEVTRRLYRDGASEYLLNRNRCRLRDLRELLMDTGSGPGALTFMEQGRIDEILRESQTERRAVFEEAAGIARYRARRRESLRRLERMEADLLRLSDVADEKQRQLRSLKIQAGRAERYQALVDEMRRRRLELAVYRYGLLLGEREEAGARLAVLVRDEDAARARVQEVAGSCREAEDELESVRTAASTKEAEIASLEGRAEAAREKGTFAARLVAELDGKSRWYRDELESGAETLDRLTGIRTEVSDAIEAARVEQEERREELSSAEAAVARAREVAAGRRVEVDRLAEKVYASLELQSRLDSRRSRLEARAQGLAERERRLVERSGALTTSVGASRERATAAQTALAASHEAAEQAARGLAAAEQHATEVEAAAAEARVREAALDREVSALRSRRDVLQALDESREGVGEGASALLDAARTSPDELAGVRGLLADLVEADGADAVLVETALGPYATAVVVDRFADAERAVAHLAERGLGRVVLLPLDTVSAEGTPAVPPGARSVLDAVRCADDVRAAVEAVLADAVVVDDLAAARALRTESGAGLLRAVTADGDVLDAAGAISGGGAPGGTGVLQRKTELRELRERFDEAAGQLEQAQARARDLAQAVEEARERIGAARAAQKEADAALHRARHEAHVAEAEADRLAGELEELEAEVGEIRDELHDVRSEDATVGDELKRLAAERRSDEEARAAAALRAEEAETALTDADADREEARVALASVSERHASLSGRMRGIEREFSEIADAADEAKRELEACAGRRKDAQERVEEAHRDLAQAEKDRERCIRELVEMRHVVSAAQAQLLERRGALESLESDASGVTREVQTYRLKESEARVRVESLIERIQEELEIDLHTAWDAARQGDGEAGGEPAPAAPAAPDEPPEEFDADALEVQITELKSRLDRMGAVNLEALAQLESVTEEAESLQVQLDDLQRARQSLLASIQKMDAESRERFTKTFEAIRTNFREMFRRLFGGGRADVFLEEGRDILEAGVEIVARPPGKELRSISLLSGGERTMTAVALMFAIYMAKPSPFCLLDEVDAALDESNIDRFVSAVTGFAEQSQFIIVTHNKRTMSMADTIFGVSMPERGVSRRVAVHLDQVDDQGRIRAECWARRRWAGLPARPRRVDGD
jgi:chromosome segregation protein